MSDFIEDENGRKFPPRRKEEVRRNPFRESRDRSPFSSAFVWRPEEENSFDDRREDPTFGCPSRALLYPSNFNPGVREEVTRRDGYTCHICKQKIKNERDLTLDHHPPLAERFDRYEYRFPYEKRKESFNNTDYLFPAHRRCNSGKGSRGVKYDSRLQAIALNGNHYERGYGNWQACLPEYKAWMDSEVNK